jgi:hypothetical protein
MLLPTIDIYKYLYRLLFANTKSRLIYILHIRRIVFILLEYLTNCVKPAFYILVAYPLFTYILKLASVDTLYLRISVFKALNPFIVNIIERVGRREKV